VPSVAWTSTAVTVASSAPTVGVGGTGHGTTGVQAFAVGVDGTLIGELDLVTVGTLSEPLNGAATLSFSLAADDTVGLALVEPWESEVQVYVDGALKFWGVPTVWRGVGGGAVVEIGLSDVSVWASKRLSSIVETDDVRNGDFSTGWERWGHTGASLDTGRYRSAPQSVLLESRSELIGQGMAQRGPSTLSVSAWFYVPSSATYTLPPFLAVSVLPVADGRGAQDVRVVVPDDIERDTWVQLGVSVTVPEGQWQEVLWIYGGDGDDVWVDDVSAQQVGVATWTHSFDLWSGAIRYADSSEFAVQMLTESMRGLNFGFIAAPTGFWMDPGLNWWDKTASEVLEVLTRLGIAWRLDVTPSTRTLRFGNLLDDLSTTHAVTLDASDVASSSWETGGGRVTRALVFGPDGRAVLVSDDTAEPASGPVDAVVQAPAGTPMEHLDDVGLRWLRESPASTVAVSVTGVDAALVGAVRPRDRIDLAADLAGPGGAGEYLVTSKVTDLVSGLVDLQLAVP